MCPLFGPLLIELREKVFTPAYTQAPQQTTSQYIIFLITCQTFLHIRNSLSCRCNCIFLNFILSLCLDLETHLHHVNTGPHMHTSYESNVLTSAGGQEAGAQRILINIFHDFSTHHIYVYMFTT